MPDKVDAEERKTCRRCGHGPYIPDFVNDFYEDGVAGPGTGLCEECMMSPGGPVEIPKNIMDTFCKLGAGTETCKFLVVSDGFMCGKGSNLHQHIEDRAKTMRAKGDNCCGPRDFKRV